MKPRNLFYLASMLCRDKNSSQAEGLRWVRTAYGGVYLYTLQFIDKKNLS